MEIRLAKPGKTDQFFVHFYAKDGKNKVRLPTDTPQDLKKAMNSAAKNETYKGAFGELALFRSGDQAGHLYAGLGDPKKMNPERLRQLAGKIYQKLKTDKIKKYTIPLESFPFDIETTDLIQALTESLSLCAYTFDDFKGTKNPDTTSVTLSHSKATASMKSALAAADVLTDCQNFSRWLGDCPGNFMTPSRLAKETEKKAKGTGLKVTSWNKAKIAKEKMDSLIGVSNGSNEEPRFIVMEYNGAGKTQKPVCFVGKGLTFDSGGISLKPGAGMEEMKYDMCGGANVIGAALAIARLKLKVNLVAYVAASENMPGPDANKPGDIRAARNGKTIEINNTDAEGRLILADALSYASEKKPAWICDAATLTGAMMVALGRTHTGFYSRHSKLAELVGKASSVTGEKVWQMPLTDDHTNDMKGTYADLNNIGPHRFAGSAQAAAFLENFVGNEVPWVHCDIAGTAWHVGRYFSYYPAKGASGAMVRTFVEMAKQHKA